MKKRTKIRHDRLENCSGKILAITDFKRVIAICIVSMAIHVREIKKKEEYDDLKFSDIEIMPLKLMDCFSILGVCPCCKSIVTARFEHKYQLLDGAMEFLLTLCPLSGHKFRYRSILPYQVCNFCLDKFSIHLVGDLASILLDKLRVAHFGYSRFGRSEKSSTLPPVTC